MNNVSRSLIKIDNCLDYIPFVSTVSNIVVLFLKCQLSHVPRSKITDHYYKYLKDKSCTRCIVLLLPVTGNIIILIYDSIKNKNTNISISYSNSGNNSTLKHASDGVKDTYDAVFKAVQQNPLALQYASARLKNNPTLVSEAVKENGYALQYASNDVKDNYDVVLKAVQENSYALKYASARLKNNPTLVSEAVKGV